MRWKVLAVLFALTAATSVFTVFYLDSFLKGKIESVGSSIVGAKVSLESLDLSLTRQAVRITGLQVANPGDPWKNMFELKSAEFDFSLIDLLVGKVKIEKLAADRPMWDTARESYGGLKQKSSPKKEKPKKGAGINWSKYLPSVDLKKEFSIDSVVNPEKMQSLKKIEAIRNLANGRDEFWKKKIEELKKKVEAVQKKAVPAEIVLLLKTIQETQKEFNKDIKTINEGTKLINRLRDSDLKDISALIGIGGSGKGGLSQEILSDAFRKRLAEGYNTFATYRDKVLKSEEPKEERKDRLKGTTIKFPVKNRKPAFHLVNASFNIDEGERKGNWFAGTLSNLSSNPALTGLPTLIDIKFGADSLPGGDFLVSGEVDLTGDIGRFALNIKAANLPASTLINALGDDAPVTLSGGAINAGLVFKITGKEIDSRFDFNLHGVKITARDKVLKNLDASVGRILKNAVSKIDRIMLTAKGKGDADDLRLSVTSNLDNILKKIVDSAVKQARKEIEKRVREELDRRIAIAIPELKGILSDEGTDMTNLASVTKKMQKKFESKAKKRVEEEIKKRFKLPF